MRKIYLLLILFLLTGCGNSYELEINKNSLTENVYFTLKPNDYSNAVLMKKIFNIGDKYYDDDRQMGEYVINYIKENDLQSLDGKYYQKKIDGNQVSLNYTYSKEKFPDSIVFNSCFGDTYYEKTKNYYVIKGYNSFKCVFDKKTVVSIKTNYRVIDSNADKVRGNKYIWVFDSNNNLNHELYIQVSNKYRKEHGNYFPLIITVIAIFIVLLVSIYKRNGKIFKFRSNNDV